MAEHNKLGKIGEEKAREYLISKGYVIKHCNWRSGKNELDIITVKDDMLVVVEVKSRTSNYFEEPEDAVTLAKIRRIVSATHDYIILHDLDCEVRFDVISIVVEKNEYKIHRIEDAFMAPLG